jgi:hypothetical protein
MIRAAGAAADRHRVVGWAATVAAITGVAAVALARPAFAVNIEQYIEVPQCQPATSQVCPQIPEVNFTSSSGEFVLVQFTANQNHCADMIAHILIDGYPQFSAPVGPGETVERKLGVGGGDHVLGVRAEGIHGGCNTGVVHAWGGTVRIASLIDPDDLRQGRFPFAPPPLEDAEP